MRARWAVLVVVVCLVVTALAIVYAGGKRGVPVQKVVRARRFELVDAARKVRRSWFFATTRARSSGRRDSEMRMGGG